MDVRIDWQDEPGATVETTLEAIISDDDGIDEAEGHKMRAVLERGDTYWIGGGASARAAISRCPDPRYDGPEADSPLIDILG